MKRILITGATGNIGTEVIRFLIKLNADVEIIAGVRSIEKAKTKQSEFTPLSFRTFDFENPSTFNSAFKDVDVIFLLRPPHISDVETFFSPLLNAAKANGIKNIVFLSVQGADKSKVIPHNKIERLIKALGFNFIFVRPSYFMQNLTTTLLPEIIHHQSISLPAKNAKFNWVDVQNIGEACAKLIADFEPLQNKAYDITGTENMNFGAVVRILSEVIGKKITFKNMNPISFYIKKRKEGLNNGFAVVMTMLHFLPRLQEEPEISQNYKNLTGKTPTTVNAFILREKKTFIGD